MLGGAEQKGFEGAVEGVEEEVAGGGVGGDEEGFAVVAEFEFCPVGGAGGGLVVGGGECAEVEGCEGRFVVVPQVVEKDRGGAGRSDGEHRRGRVIRCQRRGGEVQPALRRGRRQRPEPDGVVERSRHEGVGGGRQGEGGDGRGVGFEVAQVLVVVGGEVADGVVALGGGVEDRLGVVGEAREVGAVLFREERLQVPAFFRVVQLERLVAARGQQEFAAVVEGQGCYGAFGLAEAEELWVAS